MNSSDKGSFIERDTIVVNRLQLAQDFIHPEKVRLQLNKKVRVNPIDIGALAYTIRKPQKNSYLAYLPDKVDKSSFQINRRKLLVALHDFIVTTGNLDKTVQFHLTNFKNIITWFDENGYHEAFESQYNAREAYKAYVEDLNHQIKSIDLKLFNIKTANSKQLELIKLMELYWGNAITQEIIREIPMIKFVRKEAEIPEECNVRFATKTFLHLARGFKSFVIDNNPFPYLLKMPEYECYIFPSHVNACVTPYTKTENLCYHYQKGRTSTAEEYMMKCSRTVGKNEAQKEVEKSQSNLDKININSRNSNRLNYASLAMQSYMQLFILMTGINASELCQLEYDDSFTFERDLLKNDFRALKMRAAGREVIYHLGNRKGLDIFKEYIQLRNWVLDGVYCPYLFFIMEKHGTYTGDYLQIKAYGIHRVYKKGRGKFFPSSFTGITTSQVRKYKTVVWNELNLSQEVIADSLNHTSNTNHKYYAVSIPEKQKKEFGLFFESAQAAARQISARGEEHPMKCLGSIGCDSNDMSIASGHCDNFQFPRSMEAEPPILPDCNSQMGCLYCENYICHADEQDIKKLYSLLYVIESVRNMSIDFTHSDTLLLELSIRINLILSQMSKMSNDIKFLVNEIKKEVMDHGILTIFWEFRLRRYEQMGVVI